MLYIVAISVIDLICTASDWLIVNLGTKSTLVNHASNLTCTTYYSQEIFLKILWHLISPVEESYTPSICLALRNLLVLRLVL